MSVGNNGIDVRDVLHLFSFVICVKRFCFEKMSSVISRNVDRYIALCLSLYRTVLTVISHRVDRYIALQISQD